MVTEGKLIEHLVVDTTAFIENAPLQNVSQNIYTVAEVVNEIVNKRQLRRLCVLPYELIVKDVFPENVQAITDFAKKTGDYASLSATDIKVMALTYQLEKEHVGTTHLRDTPIAGMTNYGQKQMPSDTTHVDGFYMPKARRNTSNSTSDQHSEDGDHKHEDPTENGNVNEAIENSADLETSEEICEEEEDQHGNDDSEDEECSAEDGDDDESGWITMSNISVIKKQLKSDLLQETNVKVACITTDFAMQNVLKQMNLNVSALDGRMIKHLRTFILRCYTCFGTTSLMTKQFCPKCGNNTLKKVAVSLDEDGKQQIHINTRRPLTGRGKRFSIPTIKGGKHSNNPRLAEDQPMPQQRPSRVARMKNDPMAPDFIAGYSPFVARDVNSRSALLNIRPGETKHWMRRNPNESHKQRKK